MSKYTRADAMGYAKTHLHGIWAAALTVAEWKRLFELGVEGTAGQGTTIMSCSDQNMDVVLELADHA